MMAPTHIFLVGGRRQASLAAAAIDQGLFPGRNILLQYDTGPVPEALVPFSESPGLEPRLAEFDEIQVWNELIWPFTPGHLYLNDEYREVFRRLLSRVWGLDESQQPHLVLESLPKNPHGALAGIFYSSQVTILSGSAAVFEPTAQALGYIMGQRVERVIYVPQGDRRPQAYSEYHVDFVPLQQKVSAAARAKGMLRPLTQQLRPLAPQWHRR